MTKDMRGIKVFMIVLFLCMGAYVHGLLTLANNVRASGPLCYSCSHVANKGECNRIVQCGLHEKCFGRTFETPSKQIYFSFGCENITVCMGRKLLRRTQQDKFNVPQNVQRAANGDVQTCNQCCEGNYCNLQVCDNPKLRCLVCNDVINPNDCNLSHQCDKNHICYTEQIYINQEKRYRMGCVPKNGCVASTPTVPLVGHIIGKRTDEVPGLNLYRRTLPYDRTYCAKCCSGINCNRDLCTSTPVKDESVLVSGPPLDPCQDYNEHSCRNGLVNVTFCQDVVNKHLFCPKTCGTCTGVVRPHPTSTPIATSSVDPSCVDRHPNQCQTYRDFFCDPANHGGIDVCPVTCKKPGCSIDGGTPVLVPTSGSTTTACLDPIPTCQCEYLQNELHICNDGDPELLKFCCFFCKKVHDPNWVCSKLDREFCGGYEKPYAQEFISLARLFHSYETSPDADERLQM